MKSLKIKNKRRREESRAEVAGWKKESLGKIIKKILYFKKNLFLPVPSNCSCPLPLFYFLFAACSMSFIKLH